MWSVKGMWSNAAFITWIYTRRQKSTFLKGRGNPHHKGGYTIISCAFVQPSFAKIWYSKPRTLADETNYRPGSVQTSVTRAYFGSRSWGLNKHIPLSFSSMCPSTLLTLLHSRARCRFVTTAKKPVIDYWCQLLGYSELSTAHIHYSDTFQPP